MSKTLLKSRYIISRTFPSSAEQVAWSGMIDPPVYPRWLFTMGFLSFVCLEIAFVRTSSIVFLGTESRLISLWFPGSPFS